MFHDAYAAFLAFAGSPLVEVMKSGNWIAPVRHAEADYFKPLRLGDEVEVAICRANVAETEATLGYRVGRAPGDEVCVVGQVVHTFVDRATFKRTAMPDAVRRALLHIESGS
jgi:acyl-CoA thioesterase FadM